MRVSSQLLQEHPIRQAKNGRYYTYLYVVEGGVQKRVQINKATKEEVISELVLITSNIRKRKKRTRPFVPTLENLFEKYVHSKEISSASNNNAAHIRAAWAKYYANDPIIYRPLEDISVQEWYEWKIEKIKALHLVQQRKIVMNSLANGIYDYAIRCGYITVNTSRLGGRGIPTYLTDMNEKKKAVESQVFKEYEIPIVMNWLLSGDHGCVKNECVYLALALDFFIGLRVGELSALMVSDFSKKGVLTIQRQEIDDYSGSSTTRKGCMVVPYTKKHKNREITLPTQTIPIFQRILEYRIQHGITSEFMFCDNNNERIPSEQYHVAMRKMCEALHTPHKTVHCIRKTVISKVAMKDLNLAQSIAGHKSKQTTLDHYVFNLKTVEEDRVTLDSVFDPVFKSSSTKSSPDLVFDTSFPVPQ